MHPIILILILDIVLRRERCAYEQAEERAAAARSVAEELMYPASHACHEWAAALRAELPPESWRVGLGCVG